jgi:single-strand DNA-binding protein
MNKAILMGRLTRDPELKYTGSQVPVISFTLAVDRRFKNSSGERQADFISCVAWRQTAEFIGKYFHKGSKLGAIGNIQTRSWDDQDGKKHFATEVVVDEVYFVESKQSDGGGSYQAQQTAPAAQPQGEPLPDADDTSLPFDI